MSKSSSGSNSSTYIRERKSEREREFIRNDTRADEGADGAGEGACGHVDGRNSVFEGGGGLPEGLHAECRILYNPSRHPIPRSSPVRASSSWRRAL
jgi:hypothetical protein